MADNKLIYASDEWATRICAMLNLDPANITSLTLKLEACKPPVVVIERIIEGNPDEMPEPGEPVSVCEVRK